MDPATLSNDDPPREVELQLLIAPLDDGALPIASDPRLVADVRAALAQVRGGQAAAGVEHLRRLSRQHPRDPVPDIALGELEMRRGRFDDAERALTRALRRAPDARARLDRGMLRFRRGRTRDGYEDLLLGVQALPKSVAGLRELARLYEATGRSADARPLYARVVEQAPDVAAWLDLARVQPQDEAIDAIRSALALEPDSPPALAALCQRLARLPGAPEAIAACTRALDGQERDAALWLARGLAHSRMGHEALALADLDRAAQLAPSSPEVLLARALVRSRAGREANAAEDRRRACRLGRAEACVEPEAIEQQQANGSVDPP